jgi:hypothetical protein
MHCSGTVAPETAFTDRPPTAGKNAPDLVGEGDQARGGGEFEAGQIGREHLDPQAVQHRNRPAGRHRIGGVGFDQQRGALRYAAFLRLDNIFDRQYAGSVVVSDANGRYYEAAPGRNWLAGISARYSY